MARVLVPVAVLDGGTVSPGLMSLLGTVDVTVLGYHELPEQTPPDQARLQYEERATDALEDLREEFETAGGAAEHRLVFTRDREQTIARIAEETDADAFAISGMTGDVDRLLVSLSDGVATERVLSFVAALIGGREIGVTLFLAGDESGQRRLEDAAERLRGDGIDVRTEFVPDDPAFEALMDVLPGHDAVVVGENAPSLRSLVFGSESERLASASVGPVLVVRGGESSSE
ncbi:universal stress protein [Natronomonas sp.]|uniref:universal stress protein n=1 Tax=Natronomonas sp. TaxID=2184060 RepID=UPI0026311429|nr:universal stress protein [Natronomonas sp.]